MNRAEFTLLHRLRVRWAEVDRQDVVFNGHYFFYFDVAVTEYWRAIGLDYPAALVAGGTDLFAIKASAQFHASATYDDLLDIGCRTARLGRTSMELQVGVFRGDAHLTSGELVYVHVDLATKRSTPLPPFVREAVLRYERIPPA
jgi:acyl-CoA thioester hydrolase